MEGLNNLQRDAFSNNVINYLKQKNYIKELPGNVALVTFQ